MLKYTSYITESLTTPVQFELTDDTDLPKRIYGIFNLGDTQYGMSLEETTYDKIYELKMYRINAKKPRLWSFKNTSDLRIGLSTLLKFVESAIPFVKTKLDGVIVTIPGSSPASKFNKFLDMMIRRTYITSFRSIPVESKGEDEKNPYERLFIIRKGLTPTQLFHSKAFKKYNLSDIITDDSLKDLKLKFPTKQILKTEPSKKYKLDDIDLVADDISIDDDIFKSITNLKRMPTVTIEDEEEEEKKQIITEDEFESVYKHATTEPHNCLYIDTHPNTHEDKRLRRNFDILLSIVGH